MKLIRFGTFGNEKPGVHLNGKNYDVSSFVNDFDETFFANDGLQKLANELTNTKDLIKEISDCLLYTSPSPRDRTRSRMPSSA